MSRVAPLLFTVGLIGLFSIGCSGGDAPPLDRAKQAPSIGPVGAPPPEPEPLPPEPTDSVAVSDDEEPAIMRVFYATDRGRGRSSDTDDFYGGDFATLEYGRVEVSIPLGHEVGELEGPSIFRFEFRANPEKHIVLRSIEPIAKDDFFGAVRDSMRVAGSPEAFVFIHGYNVSFAWAARRTAQLAYDLDFRGVPMFYSWPSDGSFLRYVADEQDVRLTVPNLTSFLTEIARSTGAEKVHIVAHSMGSRALAAALTEIGRNRSEPLFDEVVFAAPDIDAREFSTMVAPAIIRTAKRITLYASSKDRALRVSQVLHSYPRAGDSGSEITVIDGIETIDASVIDTSLLGHSYFADATRLVRDLFAVIQGGLPPSERLLEPDVKRGVPYWRFGGVN